MKLIRMLSIVAAGSALALAGCAQMPVDQGGYPAGPNPSVGGMGMPMGGQGGAMSRMDEHMKAMREMHDKMMRATTPSERNALMAEQMKLMQDGMGMMGGMGQKGMGGMGSMGGMGGMQGQAAMPGDMAARYQMMEKRMEMMQSMMQMMMDRMPPAPAKP